MQYLFHLDSKILLLIQEHIRCSALDGPMKIVTFLGNAGAVWIALTLILLILRRARKAGIACLSALLIDFIAVNVALKNIVRRVRPYEVIEGLRLIVAPAVDFSFPSGHAASSFAVAWTLFRVAPKRYGVPALILAVLISLSRLYVGIHYPTDVLGGALIGIAAAEAAVALTKRLRAKAV